MTLRSAFGLIVLNADISLNGAVIPPSPLDEVIQRIAGEIGQRGSCLVSADELVVIYDGAVEESKRFARIRDLALSCHWSFELPGRMTSVTFKELPPLDSARTASERPRETAASIR